MVTDDMSDKLRQLLEESQSLMAGKMYGLAIVPLRQALALDPHNWDLRHRYIRCCLWEGVPDAIREATEELSLLLLARAVE